MSSGMTSDTNRDGTLTDAQRELLRSAVREGYFKVPREVSLVELAELNDISDVELSQQLRRGLDVVVRDATLED
ncbi:helix-turn-helix domain-containing protein [Haloarchaeobius amylolyticus]|uniref:helix-turn-helix domain-containing protein n=1 Tax=Haloarchaeobius amylolyticus TaxID=1198296 RepID=UPI002271176A